MYTGERGLEPIAYGFEDHCSTYWTILLWSKRVRTFAWRYQKPLPYLLAILHLGRMMGFEPITNGITIRYSTNWVTSAKQIEWDSNPRCLRTPVFKTGALDHSTIYLIDDLSTLIAFYVVFLHLIEYAVLVLEVYFYV